MRSRKRKNGEARMEACGEIILPFDKENIEKVSLEELFPEKKSFRIEIGCGKGSFACGLTAQDGEINLIAMERVPDVACLALEKAVKCKETRPDNLRFIIGDAKNLPSYFPPRSLDRIYLNFSDPWPKSGHAKRRLTHRGFLEIYRNLLREDGMLIFKTDNEGLFDFSLEEFEAFGATIIWQTRDLHASEQNSDNVMTEYEKNFSEKGFSICSAWVKFN